MGQKFKSLSLGKKIGLGVAGLFVVGTVLGGGHKPINNATQTKTNASTQTETANVTKQEPIHTTEVKNVTQTQSIPFDLVTKNDSGMVMGLSKVTTPGVEGTKTIVYAVTYTDGVETGRTEVSNSITTPPVSQVTSIGTKNPAPQAAAPTSACDPNYSGACVPIASDVDCQSGGGNGPAYVQGPVHVIGSDIYRLDSNGDGIGCEN